MEEAARLVQQEETQTQHMEKEKETTYGKSNASIEQLVSDFGDIQLSTTSAAAKTVNHDDAPTLQNQNRAQSDKEETGLATIRLPSCIYSSPSDTIKPLVEELDNPQQQLQPQVKDSDSSDDSSSSSSSSSSELESSSSSEEDNANTDSSETKQNFNKNNY